MPDNKLGATVSRLGAPGETVTRVALMGYVNKLEEPMRDIFNKCDRLVMENNDTLCEEFQIACCILDVFIQRARGQE